MFPNLFCLDVSFNDLCDLYTTVAWLRKLSSLKMLSLEGNPLVLAPRYSDILKEQLPGLKVIDGNTIFHDRTDDSISKNASTRSNTNSSKNNLSEIASSTGDLHVEDWADSVQKLTLDV